MKRMATESINITQALNSIKANGEITKKTAMENTYSIMETDT